MNPKKILFVDDEESILIGFQRVLRREFAIETALGPEQGLTALESGDQFAVVVVDMQMPGMNGITFLRHARGSAPDTVRVMLTGNADQQTAIAAVNEGAVFRFLTKPCSHELLKATLHEALRQHELIVAEKELLEQTLRGALAMLGDIMALAEPNAFGFAQRLRELARTLAQFMKLPHAWELEIAATLARVGQLTLPPSVISSAEAGATLDPGERALLAKVPLLGSQLVGRIPRLDRVSAAILYQSKNFDGTGYPDNVVAGAAIPLGGRILRLLIDLAGLEQHGLSPGLALRDMSRRSGWYDPELLAAATECFGRSATAGAPPTAVPVRLADLVAGNRLLADVTAVSSGLLILSKGQVVTEAHLQRLRNFAALGGLNEPLYVAATQAAPGATPAAGEDLAPAAGA